MNSLTIASALAFGFVLGLKHAVEADHLAAVSTIVSERKSILSSSLIVGLAVIFFQFEISAGAAQALEFCVGLMLIALGVNALRKLKRGGHLHLHVHRHGARAPTRISTTARLNRTRIRITACDSAHARCSSEWFTGWPGARHSCCSFSQPSLRRSSSWFHRYFRCRLIGGMMLMSALVSLPVYLTAKRFNRDALNFLKQHALTEDPKYTEYNREGVTEELNATVRQINALREKAAELTRRFYAQEAELNRLDFAKEKAAVAAIARAQRELLSESATALREASLKTEKLGKLKLGGTYPQYFSLVAQIDLKRIEAFAVMRERAELLLSDEPSNSVTVTRNEAASRAERLNKEADELEQRAAQVRAGQ